MIHQASATETFEANRPRLVGLAYRILGTVAEAEDAVQDTCLKWLAADKETIKVPSAWLTTVCTRRAVDLLRAAYNSRVNYVGTWLPEPVVTDTLANPEESAELASSITTAFLLLLERLSPKERSAYLLHEVFEHPYAEVAETLDISEPACRKLVSRARSHVTKSEARYAPPRETQSRLLEAFQLAVKSGHTDELGVLLSEGVKLAADGGGKVSASQKIVAGKHRILRFVAKALHQTWTEVIPEIIELNGRLSIVYRAPDGEPNTISFEYDIDDTVSHLYIMRNPDKLHTLTSRPIVR